MAPDPSRHPSDVALWTAALINPLPSLGVALEIRPAVLCAVINIIIRIRILLGTY